MVRLSSLSLAVFAGAALTGESQIVVDTSVPAKWSWNSCSNPATEAVDIHSIVLSPDPPKPGSDLTVTTEGTVAKTIEDGAYAHVDVRLGIIKFLSKTFDVCEMALAVNASIQCPVEKGDFVVSYTVALPKEIPPAKLFARVRGYTTDNEDMLCLDLAVDYTVRL